jgi:bifunctional non-homologous end joining protein LigD
VTSVPDLVGEEHRSGLRRARHPDWIDPMLATLTDDRFSDPGWVYERKLDGERCVGYRQGDRVRLLTRNQKEAAYPEITDALRDQPEGDLVVDGEVVAFEGHQSSFARLQNRMQVKDPDAARETGIRVYYYVFDLLHWDGYDLRGLPLLTRKSLLRRALRFADPLRFSAHRRERGEAFYREACRKGWEGLIVKRGDAPYASGRTRDWLKFKCVRDQELVVGGFTDPQGSRKGLGALLVGHYDDGDLVYAGKVGTGYSEMVLHDLRERLDDLRTDHRPFTRKTGDLPERGVHWVSPELVAQIGFTEWTRDGRLRHPRYEGLRRDKAPKDVVREEP